MISKGIGAKARNPGINSGKAHGDVWFGVVASTNKGNLPLQKAPSWPQKYYQYLLSYITFNLSYACVTVNNQIDQFSLISN